MSWREGAMEAVGLGGFIIAATLMSIVLEHPGGPVQQTALRHYPLVRHGLLGLVMGFYVALITKTWGEKSGAHINPAVTWAYYALGKIRLSHALLYTVAQFAGAVAAILLLKAALGSWFSHPAIDYSVTKPQPPYGSVHAFIAEALISFVLMAATLMAITSRRWEKKVPLITGILIALYLTFELPLSGMSLNPARSTAGALAANKWEHLWIYFVAPVGAMWAAAALFPVWKRYRTGSQNGAADWKLPPCFPVRAE